MLTFSLLYLEGLALALSSPDTQDEWDLDLGKVHEVLCHVNGHLVEESRRDVETIRDVVEVTPGSREVLGRGHNGVVGPAHSLTTLEQRVDHLATASDVLLQ